MAIKGGTILPKDVQIGVGMPKKSPKSPTSYNSKRLPRFDNKIKAHLSEYGNHILDETWLKNGANNKIVIAKQELENEPNMKIEAYGDSSQLNYDGIHMRGKSSVQIMTRTFVKMLTDLYPHLKKQRSNSQQLKNNIYSEN